MFLKIAKGVCQCVHPAPAGAAASKLVAAAAAAAATTAHSLAHQYFNTSTLKSLIAQQAKQSYPRPRYVPRTPPRPERIGCRRLAALQVLRAGHLPHPLFRREGCASRRGRLELLALGRVSPSLPRPPAKHRTAHPHHLSPSLSFAASLLPPPTLPLIYNLFRIPFAASLCSVHAVCGRYYGSRDCVCAMFDMCPSLDANARTLQPPRNATPRVIAAFGV